MRQQNTQPPLIDWERQRNEADPRTGADNPDHGRFGQRSSPGGYPESHYQYQAQQDHPGVEYFSGSPGYGGRDDYRQQQQGQAGYGQQSGAYGHQQGGQGGQGFSRQQGQGGPFRPESEFRGQGSGRQQEAFQPGARQQGYGGEDFGRGGYGQEPQGHQFGGQFGSGEHRESQHSRYGRGEFEEQPFSTGHNQRLAAADPWRTRTGYNPTDSDQRDYLGGQFQGYGGRPSGQSNAGQSSQFGGHYQEHDPRSQQSQGYGGYQSGQPQSYGAAESGQFQARSGYPSGGQPGGGYGSYGAYQVGFQSQHLGRAPRAPKDYTRSDERIRELICEHLAHHNAIDASEVSVQVKDGRVTLDGSVPERRMKHEIEDVADGCWGVKDVDNRIRVQGQAGLGRERQSGEKGNLDSAAQGWLAVPADVLTGGASTEAATGNKTSATDMSPAETRGSGASSSGTGATAADSTRSPAGTESKTAK